MSKTQSVEAAQSRTLGQFDTIIRNSQHTNITDKLTEYIERSRKLKISWDKKNSNPDLTKHVGGYTTTIINNVEALAKQKMIDRQNEIAKFVQSTNMHPLLCTAKNAFTHLEELNKTTLSPMCHQQIELFADGNVIVNMTINRCLTSALKINVDVTYDKQFFRKSDDYDTTKEIIRDVKSINVIVPIKVKYGDFIHFNRSMFAQLAEIIAKYQLADPSCTSTTKDIWSYEFK